MSFMKRDQKAAGRPGSSEFHKFTVAPDGLLLARQDEARIWHSTCAYLDVNNSSRPLW